MIVARAWGCSPADLRAVTHAEYIEMVDHLVAQLDAAQNRS